MSKWQKEPSQSLESQEGPVSSSISYCLWRIRKDLPTKAPAAISGESGRTACSRICFSGVREDLPAPATPVVSGESGRTCHLQNLLPFKLWLDSGCGSLHMVLHFKSKDAKEASLSESTVAGGTDSLLCLHSEIIFYSVS